MAEPDKPASGGSAGRGVLYIAAAKLYFVFVGFIIQFRLPAVLSRATFGAYSLVSNIASLVNNVLVTGTIQAVSRSTAQDPSKARAVQAAGLRMHLVLGLGIAALFIALAPVVSWLLHDDTKTAPLMLAGLIVAGYSFYAVFVGTANGLREFHKQAGLDMTFATLRAAGLLGMATAGFGVVGVIGGWVAAVGCILVGAMLWVGLPRGVPREERLPARSLMSYFSQLGTYLVLFNALIFVDTILLKRIMSEYYEGSASALAAASAGATGEAHGSTDPSVLADVQVAYYAAVQNLGRVSYQLIIAATFVVFPLVSRSTFEGDKETTRRYVEVTTRYSFVFASLIAVVLAALPDGVLGLVYAPDYVANGRDVMPPIAFANVAFSVFAIAGTILNGAGKTRPAILTALGTLVLAGVGDYIAIPLATDSGHALEVAAYVTGSAMLLGAIVSGVVLVREFGGFLPLASLARVGVAIVAAIAVGRVLPSGSKIVTLGEAVVVGLVFLVILVVTRELGAKDLQAIKAVRQKRAPQGDAT